jgi:hypothetical protein
MIGRQAKPCMNLCLMYRSFDVVPQLIVLFIPFLFFSDFRSYFFAIFS